VFIEGLEEDEVVEQYFVEAKTMQTNVGEEIVTEVEIQPFIKVQAMAKTQRRVMEMERCELKVLAKRSCAILYSTLLEKGIKIPNLDQIMWT
jgi:hypothetical protein